MVQRGRIPCWHNFTIRTVHKYINIIKGCYPVTEVSSEDWNLSWSPPNLAAFQYKNPNTKTFVNIPADPTRMRTEFNSEPCGVSGTRYFTLRSIMFRDVCPGVTIHKLALLFILRSVSWLEMEGAWPGGSVGNTVYRNWCSWSFRLVLRYHSTVAYRGWVWGVQPPPPKFRRPSKIVPNSTRFVKTVKNCWI